MSLHLLEEIGARLAQRPEALGLLALGSCGLQTERMDEFSDLDFFVIAEPREALLADLSWLGDVEWSHRNTPDGHQALVDGMFCEFAVFTPTDLQGIGFTRGRYVWRREGCPEADPNVPGVAAREWLVGEILANLYMGLSRWLRGERMSAFRMIQHEALSNLLRWYRAPDVDDPFDPTRRAERLDLPLAELAPGYDHTPSAAQAILQVLAPAPNAMTQAVEARLHRAL